ncbi:MAG TPA: hypothetical protein VG147_13985 [Solirubrobacteraceae bacterium]|nr:hypothetical protein [Solirubrobacteraceae bacterium]
MTPLTQVTTTTALVTKGGGSCSGTSAGGALELATKGDWEGEWDSKFSDYELTSIDGHSYPFGEGLPYWSFWLNNKEATVGICEAELEPGDQVLFFPSCFSETGACPAAPDVLGIEAPLTAEVNKPFAVTVNRYNAEGKRSPAAGVTVEGGGSSAETNFEGHATLTFPGDETYTLSAIGASEEKPKSVPGEALVCAHEGDDGECGTPRSPGSSALVSGSTGSVVAESAPYTGPYAVVADVSGITEGHVYPRAKAPRVLTGTVSAHASVTSISLRLRRSYRGRCWAYNGARERFEHVRCGQGGFFGVASGGDSFSYLLPSRLPPGRYVLDIAATDSAGNSAPLDRGSSRIVFYVK